MCLLWTVWPTPKAQFLFKKQNAFSYSMKLASIVLHLSKTLAITQPHLLYTDTWLLTKTKGEGECKHGPVWGMVMDGWRKWVLRRSAIKTLNSRNSCNPLPNSDFSCVFLVPFRGIRPISLIVYPPLSPSFMQIFYFPLKRSFAKLSRSNDLPNRTSMKTRRALGKWGESNSLFPSCLPQLH